MNGKRIALWAVAAALPMTALAVAPASAADNDRGHRSHDPSISITRVSQHRDSFRVSVRYQCDTDRRDRDGNRDRDRNRDRSGRLEVRLLDRDHGDGRDDGDRDRGDRGNSRYADCDGRWHYDSVTVYNNRHRGDRDRDRDRSRSVTIKATIVDPQHRYDSDTEYVRVRNHD